MSRMKKESIDRGIETVKCPRTTDGKIWESESEALEHQRDLDFDAFYEDNKLLLESSSSECADNEIVRQWLKENQWHVFRYLGV